MLSAAHGDPEKLHAYARHQPFAYARHLHWAEAPPSPEAAVCAASRGAEAVQAAAELAAERRAAERAAEIAAEILAAGSPPPDGGAVEPSRLGETAFCPSRKHGRGHHGRSAQPQRLIGRGGPKAAASPRRDRPLSAASAEPVGPSCALHTQRCLRPSRSRSRSRSQSLSRSRGLSRSLSRRLSLSLSLSMRLSLSLNLRLCLRLRLHLRLRLSLILSLSRPGVASDQGAGHRGGGRLPGRRVRVRVS